MDKEIFAWYTKDLPRNSVKRACYVVREFLRYTKVTQNQETGTLECEVLPGCAVTFEEYEDIYRVLNEDPMIDIFWYKEFENLKINDKAIDMFKQEKLLKYKDIKNNADLILVFYGYIFDFNFPYGLEIIRENKCLEDFAVRISNTFKSKKIDEDVQQIIKICNEYIDKKIKNT